MVDYNKIFLQKTGQFDVESPWDDTKIKNFLVSSSYLVSRGYATPWGSFDDVPEKYKYPVVVYAAIEFWWAKLGEYATKYDVQAGGGTNQRAGSLFSKAMEMLKALKIELEDIAEDMTEAGSPGDILVGDLVKRSKLTGNLVPYSTDPSGNWLS